MNYEKKYKEALERARQFSEHPLQEDSSNIVEYIFPELQESKDERIRKEIIETFKILGDGKIPVDINYADIFTWLEKQGEKKPAWSEDDEKRLQSCINILKAKSLMGKVDTANTMWLKSLKQRIGG